MFFLRSLFVVTSGYMSILFEGTLPILGANFLQDYDVHFDTENSRIGFAEASCDWSGPFHGPTPSPTLTPAPTITLTPTSNPTKEVIATNNGAVEVAIVLSLISICVGVSFAAGCSSFRRYHRDRAKAKASRGSGVFTPDEGVYGKVCRCATAVAKRCGCCPDVHRFDKLDDDDDIFAVEIPEKFSGSRQNGDHASSSEPSTKNPIQSMAKNSIAHANKFLTAKNSTAVTRPGEGSEF
jgi:hypothetical protein